METFPVSIFNRKEDETISSISDLAQKRVAVIKLNIGEKLIKQEPTAMVKNYEHVEDALFSLLSGNIDALILDLPSWYFNQDFHLRKNPEFESDIINAFCLGKKHKKPLIPIIQRAICPEDRARAYKELTEKKVPVFGDPSEFIPLLEKISNFSKQMRKSK